MGSYPWTFGGKRCWNFVVIRAIFKIITAIEEPAGNTANSTVKSFELSRADRNTIKKRALRASIEDSLYSFQANEWFIYPDERQSARHNDGN